MKLAIVGATGMVGTAILKVLEERNFIPEELIPVASDASAGKKIAFNSQEHTVITIKEALKKKPDIAIFSAGKNASLEYAPLFAKIKTRVVDNSSAW
ncbi:MAG: aspartate-semialdehyde dehydrogenase, partial [Bacteroidales bacterium]|nr:aspartate-semialdehyde dehydrogenase [Bacteroidales bacterium]